MAGVDVSKYLKSVGVKALKPWTAPYRKKTEHEDGQRLTRQERIRESQIEARDKQSRLWRMYLEGRQMRLAKLLAEHKPVARLFKHLKRIEVDTEATGWRDVDADVVDLMRQLKVQECLTGTDNFLVYEELIAWVERVEKRCGTWRFDHPNVLGDGDDETNTRLQIRQELRIR